MPKEYMSQNQTRQTAKIDHDIKKLEEERKNDNQKIESLMEDLNKRIRNLSSVSYELGELKEERKHVSKAQKLGWRVPAAGAHIKRIIGRYD